MIKTSVSVVYLLVYYSIYHPPLLCTSFVVIRISACHPYINPIESSPNDQTQPKLFVSINSTDIYISSDKFVMNGPISMEVRFNIIYSHCHEDGIIFHSILKNFKDFGLSRTSTTHSKKAGSSGNPPSSYLYSSVTFSVYCFVCSVLNYVHTQHSFCSI
jgi:hypothetical protein